MRIEEVIFMNEFFQKDQNLRETHVLVKRYIQKYTHTCIHFLPLPRQYIHWLKSLHDKKSLFRGV